MNIEEERKVFEESDALEFCRYSAFEEDYFKVWIAAKEHAKEMEKRYAIVYEGIYGWGVRDVQTNDVVKFEFSDQREAEQWAKDNGYRVVDE